MSAKEKQHIDYNDISKRRTRKIKHIFSGTESISPCKNLSPGKKKNNKLKSERHSKPVNILHMLIGKVLLLAIIISIGMISLIKIIFNVCDTAESIRAKQQNIQLLPEMESLEEIERKRTLEEEQARLEAARKQASLKKYMEKLKAEAQPYIENKEFEKASVVFTECAGWEAEETEWERQKLASDCIKQGEIWDAEQKRILLNDIISNIVTAQYPEAFSLYSSSKYGKAFSDIESVLKELAEFSRIIAETFKSEIGKELILTTADKKTIVVNISRIESGDVYVKEKGSPNEFKIKTEDMAGTEISRRLSAMGNIAKSVYIGVEAYKMNDYDTAKTNFSKTGAFLSPLLLERLLPMREAADNATAKTKFYKVLDLAEIKNPAVEYGSFAKELESKNEDISEEKARNIKRALDIFQDKFRGADFVKEKEMFISLLSKTVNDKVDRLNYSTDLKRWNSQAQPIAVNLSKDKPKYWETPAPPKDNMRYYTTIKLVKKNRINLLLDLHDKKAFLYYSFDDDTDFTSKKPLPKISRPIELLLEYPDNITQKYSVSFRYDRKAEKLYCVRNCLMEGRVEIDGNIYTVALADENTDGNYSDLKYTRLFVETEDGILGFPSEIPIKIADRFYKVNAIHPSGERVNISPARLIDVSGIIGDYSNMQAVANAEVAFVEYDISLRTDAKGTYKTKLPEGKYRVKISAEGYNDYPESYITIKEKTPIPAIYLKPVK